MSIVFMLPVIYSYGSYFIMQQVLRATIIFIIICKYYCMCMCTTVQIHRIYAHDLKQLFTVEPHEVLQRVKNSFIPGRHSAALVTPDIYGPLVAVFTLPQVWSAIIDNEQLLTMNIDGWYNKGSLFEVLDFNVWLRLQKSKVDFLVLLDNAHANTLFGIQQCSSNLSVLFYFNYCPPANH
jgi:hypothetical protein